MKEIKYFEQFKLANISLVYAGELIATGGQGTIFGCDYHDDENGNGKIDPGECVTFVEC